MSNSSRVSLHVPDAKEIEPLRFETMVAKLAGCKDREAVKAGKHVFYRSDVWQFLRSSDYNRNPGDYRSEGCKVHVNFAQSEQLGKAWDAILPVLLKYSDYIHVAKVLRADILESLTQQWVDAAEKENARLKKLELDGEDGVIYEIDDLKMTQNIQKHLQARDRYQHGANMLFYFFAHGDVSFAELAPIFKAFVAEIDAVLVEGKFTPGVDHHSDFPVDGCKFVSITVDRLKGGKFKNFADRKKSDMIENVIVQQLVSPDDLKEDKAQPVKQFRKQEKVKKLDFIEEIRKVVNPESQSFWENEMKVLPKKISEHFNKLQTCLDQKTEMSTRDRLDKILDAFDGIGEVITSSSHEGFFKVDWDNNKIGILCETVCALSRCELEHQKTLQSLSQDIANFSAEKTVKQNNQLPPS